MGFVFHDIAAAQFEGYAIGTVVKPECRQKLSETIQVSIVVANISNAGLFGEEGQAVIPLGVETIDWIIPGVAQRKLAGDMYKLAYHRGEYIVVMDRQKAVDEDLLPEIAHVSAVVYNAKGVLEDPQVEDGHRKHFTDNPDDFLLVTLLTGTDSPPELSSHRLVRNMAGGNIKYLNMSASELRDEATRTVTFEQNWIIVG
jgi:hypothetical protein